MMTTRRLACTLFAGVLTAATAREARAITSVVQADEHTPTAVSTSSRDETQPADSLFREGTRLLTRGQYDRAAALFEQLRLQHPRSPYVADSYYWQAFALQRADNSNAMRRALLVLEEQQLRFPEAASSEDVVMLRERIEGVLGRDRVVATGTCRESDDDNALAELMLARDREWVRGYLTTILAKRDACTRELRRAAVYLLGRQRDEPARAVLQQVALRDPDELVRGEARRLAVVRANSAADSARALVPPRSAGDTVPHAVGDFEVVPLRLLKLDRTAERLQLQLGQPMQLIVLAVTPGRGVELIEPASRGDSKLRAAGAVSIDLRRVMLADAAAPNTLDRGAADLRREAEMEGCMARQTEKARKEADRQWQGKGSTGKPVVPQLGTDRVDASNAALVNYGGNCSARAAQRVPTTMPTGAAGPRLARVAGAREQSDQVLVVLASPKPINFTLLVARLGAMPVGGATRRAMVDAIAADLFEGHAAPWSGAFVAW